MSSVHLLIVVHNIIYHTDRTDKTQDNNTQHNKMTRTIIMKGTIDN